MNLTPEQLAIVNAEVPPGGSVKMLAYAGTGKTHTLTEVARKFIDQCLYIAFNKSVASDAAMRFPCNTTPMTGHALAYKFCGAKYRSRLGNLQNWHLGKAYGFKTYESALLLRSLESFLCSADPSPNDSHIEPDYLHRMDPGKYTDGMVYRVAKLWDNMLKGEDQLPMTHSGYLKEFQLQKNQLGYGVVLLDEAQDTNPVMHRIVLDQAEAGARVYLVGDPYQQIYSWRGAVDAMAKIDCPEYRITQSFRFGPQIAEVGSKLLSTFFGEKVPLRGFESIESKVGLKSSTAFPYTVLCRTNSGLVREAYHLANSGAQINVVGEQAFQQTLESVVNIYFLWSGKKNLIQDRHVSMHHSFAALKTYAEETLDVELKSKVMVVEEHGSDWPNVESTIRGALCPAANADVILTTTHKAKGLEWDNVRIAEDFEELYYLGPDPDHEGEQKRLLRQVTRDAAKAQGNDSLIHSEEINLLYVAVTRAKKVLQPTRDILSLMQNFEGTKPSNA